MKTDKAGLPADYISNVQAHSTHVRVCRLQVIRRLFETDQYPVAFIMSRRLPLVNVQAQNTHVRVRAVTLPLNCINYKIGK